MSALCSSNLSSGFIDLATYDEIERYMYGGDDATAYFVRCSRKSTWFTQVPACLARATGTAAFGQDWSANISRAGDYALTVWLRLTVSSVTGSAALTAAGDTLRWTDNFMHNLISEMNITFNDLVAERLDNFFLDFWAAFTLPANKQNGYLNMIGSFDQMTNPGNFIPVGGAAAPRFLQQQTLNLPLPLFFTRDSGVGLPMAALPYNEVRLNFSFRDWTQLLIVSDPGAGAGTNPHRAAVAADVVTAPTLSNVQVWCNYAIVSNEERSKMGCQARPILIEQVQTAPVQALLPATVPNPQYDVRFSHAIKNLFFAARNTTTTNEWSNYTTACPQITGVTINREPVGFTFDPITNLTLTYENQNRLFQMGADYYSLVQPFYQPNAAIPTRTGLHMYSYSLDFLCLDPLGSTNYGKLTNVSLQPASSPAAIASAAATGMAGNAAFQQAANPPYAVGSVQNQDFAQTYSFVIVGVNNNIIRISGGALGFPVL